MEILEHRTNAVRHTPYILNNDYLIAVGLGYGGGIGIYFRFSCGIAGRVYYNCESIPGHRRNVQERKDGYNDYTV